MSGLLREGRAMLTALAVDFARVPGCQVQALWGLAAAPPSVKNCRWIPVQTEIVLQADPWARRADWCVVIAPELGGTLSRLATALESGGARLLSPDARFAELASDKQATAQRLCAAGVPAPLGVLIPHGGVLPRNFPLPAVLKPRFGAGSLDIQRIDSGSSLAWSATAVEPEYRLERWHSGAAASVAVLCGPRGNVALPGATQQLTGDGHFHNLGGRIPLAAQLQQRASRLALAAVAALGSTRGYVGVDLVLGENPDAPHRGDCVIEVNPRLTTSYLGLRELLADNLAAAMLAVASGDPLSLHPRDVVLEFDAEGRVWPAGDK